MIGRPSANKYQVEGPRKAIRPQIQPFTAAFVALFAPLWYKRASIFLGLQLCPKYVKSRASAQWLEITSATR